WLISSASWKTFQASSGNSSSWAKAIASTSSSVAGRSDQLGPASPGAVISAAQGALARGRLGGVGRAQVHRLGAAEVGAAGGELRGDQQQVAGVHMGEVRGRGQQLGVERRAGADEQVAGGELVGDVCGGGNGGLGQSLGGAVGR